MHNGRAALATKSCKDCRRVGLSFWLGKNDQFGFWWGCSTQAVDTWCSASSQDIRARPVRLAAAL